MNQPVTAAQLRNKPPLAPVDPNVNVPPAVRAAAAAADARMKAEATPQPEPPAPAPAPGDTITIAPPPQPDRLPGQVPLTIEPAPPPAPDAPPAPQPTPAPTPTEPDYKNMYEAQVGRVRALTRDLGASNSRIEALENMLANMSSAPRAAADPAPAPKLITEKDIQEMGPEMIDLMRRAAREELGGTDLSAVKTMLAELQSRVGSVQQNVTLSAKQQMHNLLDTSLPNWNEINHAEDFHAWLALRDGFSGVTRKTLLTQAYAANDGPRVLAIFEGFVSETASQRPASPNLVPAPAPSTQPAAPNLADLAAPGRARTAATPQTPAEKQIIRTSDVNAFYAAVRKGLYKGREQEQAAHEAELGAAMREGRVVRDT